MEIGTLLFAFALTLIAALATVVGGFMGIRSVAKKPTHLSIVLGFAAGAMICLSLLELLPVAHESLAEQFSFEKSLGIIIASFIGGALIVYAIDRFLSKKDSFGVLSTASATDEKAPVIGAIKHKKKLLRSGITVAVIMAVHNFPEGMVTFTGAMHDVSLGLSLALAIALHNIPEGIAIASPIYAATSDKVKALKYTLFSAIAEPLGAIFGFVLLTQVLPESMFGVLFAATAGMMIYISISELLPSAHAHSTHRQQPLTGMAVGAATVALSLFAFSFI